MNKQVPSSGRHAPVLDSRIFKTGNPQADFIQMKVLTDLGTSLGDVKADKTRQNRRKYCAAQLRKRPANKSGQDFTNAYVTWFFKSVKENHALRDFLAGKLSGQTVVDLGCGSSSSVEIALKMMEMFGASKYVAVDLSPSVWSAKLIEKANMKGEIEAALVREDMVLFAASLKDSSVNFLISGIDDSTLCDKEPRTVSRRDWYGIEHIHWRWKALASDIARATVQGGIVFGNDRSAIGNYIEKLRQPFANFFPSKDKDLCADICIDPYSYVKA